VANRRVAFAGNMTERSSSASIYARVAGELRLDGCSTQLLKVATGPCLLARWEQKR
jgi:hypothetical protein